MESFRFSEPAQRDFDEILDYVALRDGLDRASVLEDEILSAVGLLARMPGMGHWREDLPPSLRAWAVHKWLVLYRPQAAPLEVVRIVGGWQDVSSRVEERDLD